MLPNSPQSLHKARTEIARRSIRKDIWMPTVVFPERIYTNGKALISFTTGE